MKTENRVYVPAAAGFYRLVAYDWEGQVYWEAQAIVAWRIVPPVSDQSFNGEWAEPICLEPVALNGQYEAIQSPDGRVVMQADREYETRESWQDDVAERIVKARERKAP